MELEVMPRRGEVRVRDVRETYGPAFTALELVDVLVLDANGGVPVAATVAMTDLPGGRRIARAFSCPGCSRAVLLLLARGGLLRCGKCHRFLTRRQRERTLADFVRRGGQLEDELLRMLPPSRSISSTRIEEARRLAMALLAADRVRLAELRRQLRELTELAEARR
jgi:hypothetical protein